MKILFISHAYPPTVGGVENQNYELSIGLEKITEIKILANGRGKNFLPIWMPYTLLKCLFLAPRYDVILLGNALLAHMGWILKIIFRKPVIAVAHGLDLTFKNWVYQTFWVGFFIKKMDRLVAVGNETIRVGKEKNIPENKFVFIPNGVDAEKFSKNYPRSELEEIIKENLENKKVLLTSGRLAKRKGVAWFVGNVLPKLPENIIYAVAGDGPDRENIKNAIEKTGLASRVKMLGYIPDEKRNILFSTCDLFIQPNIRVEGDMEGFGISVLEAAVSKIPVIASDLEGLKDAIKDGQNGFLVEPMNIPRYVQKINELLADDNYRKEFGARARLFVIENYSWEKIAQKYLEEIKKLV